MSEPQTLNRYAYVTNNPATLIDHLGYFGWGDIGNAIGGAAQGFMDFSNGLSESVSRFSFSDAFNDTVNSISNLRWGSYGREDTRPQGRPATLPETSAAPLNVAQANSGGASPGNNATSGTPSTPVQQNWDQRPGLFFNYWGTVASFIPVGGAVRPAVQWLAKIAQPLRARGGGSRHWADVREVQHRGSARGGTSAGSGWNDSGRPGFTESF